MTDEGPNWRENLRSYADVVAEKMQAEEGLRDIMEQMVSDLMWLTTQTEPSRAILDIQFADRSFSVIIIETAHPK